jgi:tetratricopeptide (TPR) repeat protein
VLSPRDEHEETDEIMTISSGDDDGDDDDDDDEWESDAEMEDGGVLMVWNGHSVSDLSGIVLRAQQENRNGDSQVAENLFLQAIEGHKHLLGPTHEDTSNVSYKLATFYVEHDRVQDAYRVIEESSRAFVVQLGLQHHRTQQHIMNVVELLNGWNREADALAFLNRARELAERRIGSRKRAQPPLTRVAASSGLPSNASNSVFISVSPSPTQLDYEVTLARTYAQSDNDTAETLLRRIIQQCSANNMNLVVQRLDAITELLKLHTQLDQLAGNSAWPGHAMEAFNHALTEYPWDIPTREKFKSLRIMEAFLKLGAALLKANYGREAKKVFERSLEKAEDIFQSDDERTIWMAISVGIVYQTHLGWGHAESWFERALSAAMSKYDENDGIVISLEEAREVRHFSYLNDEGRPFKTIFGVNGLTIRPTRLHF